MQARERFLGRGERSICFETDELGGVSGRARSPLRVGGTGFVLAPELKSASVFLSSARARSRFFSST
jgi:hypothetical protein